ncbi:hypothetical protein CHL67_02895 [Prosthecochloris sp. GSB1]|uniref:hypothetical protein n=1 Tax=Prosthecochloris sp. GSB1 TaxID=281093 RepID=UPI000B8D1231|nr:hypothetical protein [Prosthecochloris sp. GSB1]ASQ90011.1 hypothetical protein CHL67_02895 [Prosthecochloris sp. GSB1]
MSNPSMNAVVVVPTKSMGAGILLSFLFGPLGMLYATIPGALIMMAVSFIVGFMTMGFGALLLWPVCMIWTALAVKSHNEKLLAGTQSQPEAKE